MMGQHARAAGGCQPRTASGIVEQRQRRSRAFLGVMRDQQVLAIFGQLLVDAGIITPEELQRRLESV